MRTLLATIGTAALCISGMAEPDNRVWRTDHAGASPYTIEPGHFEAEVEAVRFSYSDQSSSVLVLTPGDPGTGGPGDIGGELGGGPGQLRFVAVPAHQVTHAWTYGAMVLKAGVLQNLDLEVSLLPWRTITTDVRTEATEVSPFLHSRTTISGFSDTTAELKLNIWGNDGGTTALALTGAVQFPTGDKFMGSGLYEGGPGLLFSADLPLGLEARINCRATFFIPPHSHLTAGFENLLGLVHPLTKTIDAYAAFDTFVSTRSEADWSGLVRVGLNYRPWRNVEFFTGSDFYVQPRTGTYAPFLGFSVLY